jgi:hypothetical protein
VNSEIDAVALGSPCKSLSFESSIPFHRMTLAPPTPFRWSLIHILRLEERHELTASRRIGWGVPRRQAT